MHVPRPRTDDGGGLIPGIADRGRSGASEVDPLSMGLAGDFGQLGKFRFWVFERGKGWARPIGILSSRTGPHSFCRRRWYSDERCIERQTPYAIKNRSTCK
jgi:hypothetical protein